MLVKDSRKGTFQSITITIEAQSEEQLRLIHQDLMDTGLVSMVLDTVLCRRLGTVDFDSTFEAMKTFTASRTLTPKMKFGCYSTRRFIHRACLASRSTCSIPVRSPLFRSIAAAR